VICGNYRLISGVGHLCIYVGDRQQNTAGALPDMSLQGAK
jgi:hypothetical protein